MLFKFVPMNTKYARAMENWRYQGSVEALFMRPYFDSYDAITDKMTGPGGCDGYAVLLEDNSLAGLFEYYFSDGIMEIGLALNPLLKGKGLGYEFLCSGIEYGIKEYDYKKSYIRLTVNTDNLPAIKIYRKAGFEEVKTYNEIEGNTSIEMWKRI